MDKQTTQVVFTVVAATIILILLGALVIALLLIGRNRRLKHRNELLKITADYQKELMTTQVEVVENTLNNISKQLHDDVGQMITFSIVQLNNIEAKDAGYKKELSEIRESVHASLQSVREISKALSTDYLNSFGIHESLQRLIDHVNKSSGLLVKSDFSSMIKFDSQANEIFAFRIIQELITNTIKHAKATEITLSIIEETETIVIKYADNGRGIGDRKPDSLSSKGSLGFANIMKRADLMKGKISIDSIEKGFAFTLTFPN